MTHELLSKDELSLLLAPDGTEEDPGPDRFDPGAHDSRRQGAVTGSASDRHGPGRASHEIDPARDPFVDPYGNGLHGNDPHAEDPQGNDLDADDIEPADFQRLETLVRRSVSPAAQAWSVLFEEPVVLDDPRLSVVTPEILDRWAGAWLVGCRIGFMSSDAERAPDPCPSSLYWIVPDPGARTLAGLVPGGSLNRGAASDLAQALSYLQVEMRSNLLRNQQVKVRTGPLHVVGEPPPMDTNYFQILLELKISRRWHGTVGLLLPVPFVRELLRRDRTPESSVLEDEFERIDSPERGPMRLVPETEASAVRAPEPSRRSPEPSRRSPGPESPRSRFDANPAWPTTRDPASSRLDPSRLDPSRLDPADAPDEAPRTDADEGLLSVELGRTYLPDDHPGRLRLGETLELDRLAGESVDIRVDRRLVARGEITVVGETLAVRVTHLLDAGRRSARPGHTEDGSPNRGHS